MSAQAPVHSRAPVRRRSVDAVSEFPGPANDGTGGRPAAGARGSFEVLRADGTPVDVGRFEQGTDASRWALSRYLVGRALAEATGRSLLIVGLVLLALAVVIGWQLSVVLAVLVGIVALGVLLLRWVLLAVLVRLTAPTADPAVTRRLDRLAADTRRDALAELRRIGLPGHTWSLPLLALRLARGRTRDETLRRMQRFETDRVVPRIRLDELHLLVQQGPGGPAR